MVKALALMSGGLDSVLAAKLVKDQGIEVIAISFKTVFQTEASDKAIENAKSIGVPIEVIDVSDDYLRMIEQAPHGYGSGKNPCIDCRMYFLKKAWEKAKSMGAEFLITGEVLGQRPMSQQMKQLKLIEEETGLKGKILRPLSGKLLPPTDAEKWLEREKLLDIQGRSRKKQLALAKKHGITSFSTPAGGCLLTEKEFAAKLEDAWEHKKKLPKREYELLKIGRHFRKGENKIIVGRNEEENKRLLELKKSELVFEVLGVGSPETLLQGPKTKEAIRLAASLTARYSDSEEEVVEVDYNKKKIKVRASQDSEIKKLRV